MSGFLCSRWRRSQATHDLGVTDGWEMAVMLTDRLKLDGRLQAHQLIDPRLYLPKRLVRRYRDRAHQLAWQT
ncbi:MAG: hypothetical protein EBV79_11425 [Betaproteobacteria bacterium]|nr:hypothetical protein [Betaproteobacteria bacterium]